MKNILLLILTVFIIAIFSCSFGGGSSSGGGGNTGNPPETSDMLPAVIDRMELDTTNINTNGTINIKVFIKDGYDNIDYVNVYLFSPRQLINNEGVRLWEWLDYDVAEDCFKGSIELNTFHESGSWKIGEISVQDTDDKSCCYYIDSTLSNDYYSLSEYYGDPGDEVTEIEIIDVTVNNTTPDLDFPVMTAYTISPPEVNDNETVTITVDVSDAGGSGIDVVYVGISIEFPNGSHSTSSGCTDIGGGKFRYTNVMESSDEDGTWHIDDIEIRDNAGNITTYEFDDWIDNDNLIMYHSDNEDNYIVTGFDVKSFVKK